MPTRDGRQRAKTSGFFSPLGQKRERQEALQMQSILDLFFWWVSQSAKSTHPGSTAEQSTGLALAAWRTVRTHCLMPGGVPW